MSWEAWGDPPDPLPTRECENCGGTGRFSREAMTVDGIHYPAIVDLECETCDGYGEIEVEYEPCDDDII